MAIVGNFEVTVVTDGKALEELEVAQEDQIDPDQQVRDKRGTVTSSRPSKNYRRTIFRYIEATPGASFQVQYVGRALRFGSEKHFILFSTSLNGQHQCSVIADSSDVTTDGQFSFMEQGAHVRGGSKCEIRPWCWGRLETSRSIRII
jgi:hypothetical protein